MRAKHLKEALKDIGDDVEIVLHTYDERWGYFLRDLEIGCTQNFDNVFILYGNIMFDERDLIKKAG
jgi:hypothetical protein